MDQARFSGSNGIELGENVASVSFSLTSLSSASTNDVSTPRAILDGMQPHVLASGGAVTALAQSAFSPMTGSTPQASALLASAASAIQSQSPIPEFQTPSSRLLSSLQITGIVIAALIFISLSTVFIYLSMRKMKRRRRNDRYLQEKELPDTPRKMNIYSRMSSMARTGNGMTIRFNPPQSSDENGPGQAALRPLESFQTVPLQAVEKEGSQAIMSKMKRIRGSCEVAARLPIWRGSGGTEEEFSLGVAEARALSRSLAKKEEEEEEEEEEVIGNTYMNTVPTQYYQSPIASSYLSQREGIAQPGAILPTNPMFSKQTPKVHVDLSINRPIIQTTDIQSTLGLSTVEPSKESRRGFREKETVPENLDQDRQGMDPFRDIDPRYLSQMLLRPPELSVIKQSHETLKSGVETLPGSADEAPGDAQVEPSATSSSIQFTLEDLLPPQETIFRCADILTMSKDEEVVAVPHFEEKTPVLEAMDFESVDDGQDNKVVVGDKNEAMSPIVLSPKAVHSHTTTELPSPMQQRIGSPEVPPRSLLREKYQIPPLNPSKPRATSPTIKELSLLRRKFSLPDLQSLDGRGLSPLRGSPQRSRSSSTRGSPPRDVKGTRNQNIKSSLADAENAENIMGEGTRGDERAERVRNMLRMSDIIHSKRLSTGMKNGVSEVAMKTVSLPRENSVHQVVLDGVKEMTLNPLRRNPSIVRAEKKRSRSLTPPRQAFLSPLSISRDREHSPLRSTSTAAKRKSRSLSPTPSPASSNTTAMSSCETLLTPVRASVSQRPSALRKFRVLDEKGPRERVEAESEVTIRARAGIYIPGSLREESIKVRGVSRGEGSKSRGR